MPQKCFRTRVLSLRRGSFCCHRSMCVTPLRKDDCYPRSRPPLAVDCISFVAPVVAYADAE